MSLRQLDLLGEEMPDPVIAFTLVVRWYGDELRVNAVPLMGPVDAGFLENAATVTREALLEEFTE